MEFKFRRKSLNPIGTSYIFINGKTTIKIKNRENLEKVKLSKEQKVKDAHEHEHHTHG